jgi:poly-gamma-glutamate capsule biosynthesis protein CapA/YwtB (metallophosphatase superfamily)
MKSYKDKQVIFGLMFLGIAAGLFGRGFENLHFTFPKTDTFNQAAAFLATQENLVPRVTAPPSISLGFVGDIMMDRGVEIMVNKNLGGDFNALFANAEFLKEPDIMFANLEGPVGTEGKDLHNLYSFRMDPEVIPALKAAGIDVVASANNHIYDWSQAALIDTISRLREGGIQTCGIGMNKTEAEMPAIFSKDSYTVGFLCFSDVGPGGARATDTTPGILLANDPQLERIVSEAAAKVDALIVSFHWGEEYETVHNARQEELAIRTINAGAAMVQGEHPHVAQDFGSYKGAPILYSLGNFIFDQGFSKNTMRGLFVTANISGKTVTNLTPHTIVMDKNFAPSLAK